MKNLMRSMWSIAVAVAAVSLAGPGAAAGAQSRQMVELLQEPSPLAAHQGSQGYLGVDLADVDRDKAQALKLREVRGALITLIDHDAPAGQVGLKVNDVILRVNGQTIEGAEQLRRILREIPAGRQVSLEVSREGNLQTVSVQLGDRQEIERKTWNSIDSGGLMFGPVPAMGMMGGGDAPASGGFHMPFFGSSLNVGAMVEPLTSQMAEYLGVQNGLMVKQVARKSEAASAGLKAFDVILKVGAEPVTTLADWDRSLRSNEGKQVQVTILRDKRQQTLTLLVDSKHRGEVQMEELFPEGGGPLVAEIDPQFVQDAAAAAKTLSEQVGEIRIDPQVMDELKLEADKLRDQIQAQVKAEDFKIDQKQMDQIMQQMEEFRKNFKAEDFKIDQKQMEELNKQTDQLKQQLKEWKTQEFHEFN